MPPLLLPSAEIATSTTVAPSPAVTAEFDPVATKPMPASAPLSSMTLPDVVLSPCTVATSARVSMPSAAPV